MIKKIGLAFTFLFFCIDAYAALRIQITRGAADAQPIAIVPFTWEGIESNQSAPANIGNIVSADLERSGEFKAVSQQAMLSQPSIGDQINFAQWRILDINHLVVGRLKQVAANNYAAEFQLFDVVTGKQIAGYSIPASRRQLRRAAHTISDIVYEEITGVKGVFNTRIAYITLQKPAGQNEYRLEVADADGFNAQTILKSVQPIMSPSWSPDGQRIAYVSFEGRKPAIYVQSVYNNAAREEIASFSGINGAPRWSPDGRQLALTLSKDGNADIYLLDIASKKLNKLTRNFSIDTEPVWTNDGKHIYFTSGRSGSPQIYKMSVGGGRAERVTFEGNYNTSANISPDGRYLSVAHGNKGRYQIGVLDQQTGLFRVLTKGRLDESPSFAPNGRILLYATEDKGRGVLAAVSVDGRTTQQLVFSDGDIREPAWSPFTQ